MNTTFLLRKAEMFGSLLSTSYSNSTGNPPVVTPSITYTRNRLGAPATITDAAGTHTFTYNTDSTLASVTIPHILNHKLEYSYDTLGRRTAMNLKNTSTGSIPVVAQYTYDAMSRIATVGDTTNTATYTRIPGSSLLNTTTISSTGNPPVVALTTTRTYDAFNRLTSIASTPTGQSAKAYSYIYNDRDQRTKLTLPDGSSWLYAYDEKGQVSSGVKYDSSGTAIPGQTFGYNFDDIGNRKTAYEGMPQMRYDYTANLLNQYSQRTVPGIIPITGKADPAATVSVTKKASGQVTSTTRKGTYFKAPVTVNNASSDVTEELDITAVKFDQSQDKDIVNTITGKYTVAKTPEQFTYDDDGNLLSDAKFNYTYNAENRLISIQSVNVGADLPVAKKLEFSYDYMGRRISKKVYTHNGTT